MRVPLSLLLSWCDPDLSVEEIASALALAGTEVERVTRIGVEDPSTFRVGLVSSCEQHPDADRLKLCMVDVGETEPLQIVCGAPNVAAGQLVAVALVGSTMPSGLRIKAAKLRGVESHGMICAEDELGLGSGHEGIIILEADAGPPGRPLADVLPLTETVFELEITPNRPDCLGVYGVARELHAATGAPLAPPPWEADAGSSGKLDGVSVEVEGDRICPRFTARIYDLDDADAVTPDAIRGHLIAAGMRPISPVVDITNYVMLVTGEPMHAFDLDRIAGGRLTVREAVSGERVRTLDGEERVLEAGEPLIVDSEGPTSIAGVMGGARSEVSADSSVVLLEAAVWDGPLINRTSNRLGLRSEASGRFEKGLAPVNADRAQAFASKLFAQIHGVSPRPGTLAVGELPAGRELELEVADVAGLLGGSWSPERVAGSLELLGFAVSGDGSPFTVAVPADRIDVARPVDLIEEVARIDGLDRVKASLPSGSGGGGLTRSQALRRAVADQLAASGLLEIAGWNFASPATADRLNLAVNDPRRIAVELINPMSADESQMRTMVITSLLAAAARNASRGASAIRLFEIGPVFLCGEDGGVDEPVRVAGLISGPVVPPDWKQPEPPDVDIHAGRAVLDRLFEAHHSDWNLLPSLEPETFLHPTRSGAVELGGVIAGWLGELHPGVASTYGLPAAVVFEFDLSALKLAAPEVIHYEPFSQQPQLSQDLAVIVPVGTAAASVLTAVRAAAGEHLEDASIFDVYEDDGIGEGRRSLGVRLVFRAHDRTLTEDEASAARTAALEALKSEFGAEARG